MRSITDLLNWRYGAKRMTGKIAVQEEIDLILKAAHLALSNY